MIEILEKKSALVQKHNRELLIGFCALLAIAIRLLFPAKMNGEIFLINLFLFLLFPWLVIRYLLKENAKNFGISRGNHKRGLVFSAIFIVAFCLINYFIVHKFNLRNHLQISPDIVRSFWVFLWFQLAISLPAHFSWEFFFRGFLQLGLEKKIGKYAIILQALAQTALYARSSWAIIALIGLSSLAAGVIAGQSRSIFYSFLSMWLISVSLDIMIIRYIHQAI